ncbi:hypothetical protein [Streptomyces sp. TR06-5]|uniref:hypothetical protein n=1 Tax=unclassified Streptomyces TaxID=2593676 RepID=UPI0039A1643F
MDAQARSAAEGITRIEGYLLLQSERRAARRAAEEFADRLPWLAPEERLEVVREYVADRTVLTRQMLTHVAGRCEELRAEYTDRYEELRRRLLRRYVASLLAAVVVCAGALAVLGRS